MKDSSKTYIIYAKKKPKIPGWYRRTWQLIQAPSIEEAVENYNNKDSDYFCESARSLDWLESWSKNTNQRTT